MFLFECSFNDADVLKHFKNKPFLRDILLAWSKLNSKPIILWNNSNIRADEKTAFYKSRFQSGIKRAKDILWQNIHLTLNLSIIIISHFVTFLNIGSGNIVSFYENYTGIQG